MNNKTSGTAFEKEFAKLLSINGFWVRLDSGNKSGQATDMIAGRNNKIYLFECKVCARDYFNLDRVELNQSMSMERFRICGNDEAWFVFKIPQGIYLSKTAISKPSMCIRWEDWASESDNKQQYRDT